MASDDKHQFLMKCFDVLALLGCYYPGFLILVCFYIQGPVTKGWVLAVISMFLLPLAGIFWINFRCASAPTDTFQSFVRLGTDRRFWLKVTFGSITFFCVSLLIVLLIRPLQVEVK